MMKPKRISAMREKFLPHHLCGLEQVFASMVRTAPQQSKTIISQYRLRELTGLETAPYWAWALGFVQDRPKRGDKICEISPLYAKAANHPDCLMNKSEKTRSAWYLWNIGTCLANHLAYELVFPTVRKDMDTVESFVERAKTRSFPFGPASLAGDEREEYVRRMIIQIIEFFNFPQMRAFGVVRWIRPGVSFEWEGGRKINPGKLTGFFLSDMVFRKGVKAMDFKSFLSGEGSIGRLFAFDKEMMFDLRNKISDLTIGYLRPTHSTFGNVYRLAVTERGKAKVRKRDDLYPLLLRNGSREG